MGRSRGGLTTKIHAVVDAKGLPIRLGLTPGQAYDGEAAMDLLNALPKTRSSWLTRPMTPTSSEK